jgi:AraC-like DNA-binding protein
MANQVNVSFISTIKKQVVNYQPLLLSQSLVQIICTIVNIVPPKSRIKLRLLYGTGKKNLLIEIENTGLNLSRITGMFTQGSYSFEVHPSANGTLFRLSLPMRQEIPVSSQFIKINTPTTIPPFYTEIQKRLRSHFTETEKHLASLEENRPKEAAFLQRINALINVNLDNENFGTQELCKAMSLNRTQLFRRMKTLVRQAPANYIKIIRLQKAKELLETTDLTVSESAFKTDFQTLSHFPNVFQNNTEYSLPFSAAAILLQQMNKRMQYTA